MMKITSHLLCALMVAALLWSCKKDTDVLGVDVQPLDDALSASFNATAPVYVHTLKYDSISSSSDAESDGRYKYLGINKDPYFGITDVGLYLLPNIPDGKTFVSFGDDAKISSAEIILAAFDLGISHVGLANAQVTYSVYPISTMPPAVNTFYTADDHFHSTGSVLGAYTGSYSTINGKPVLRIPVDNNFARAILSNPQYLVDNTVFQNTYKGFYIKSSLNGDEGLITRFDLEDAVSGFYLYYQNGVPPATKTDKTFRFTFGGTNPLRFNTMKHNFQTGSTVLQQQVLNNDTAKGGDAIFLKGMGVTKARVYIPTLQSFGDSVKVAVNRAELLFRIDPSYNAGTGYTPPERLSLVAADSLGRELLVQDLANSTDAARYDGSYNTDAKCYVFNIARHVQAIFNGQRKNYGFYLIVADARNKSMKPVYNGTMKELFTVRRDNYVERVVLAGHNQPTLKPVLSLSYIKLPHD